MNWRCVFGVVSVVPSSSADAPDAPPVVDLDLERAVQLNPAQELRLRRRLLRLEAVPVDAQVVLVAIRFHGAPRVAVADLLKETG